MLDAGRPRRRAPSVPVGAYSHGMQKRLSVARALLTNPSVLLVDEATHDLDPQAAARRAGSWSRSSRGDGAAVAVGHAAPRRDPRLRRPGHAAARGTCPLRRVGQRADGARAGSPVRAAPAAAGLDADDAAAARPRAGRIGDLTAARPRRRRALAAQPRRRGACSATRSPRSPSAGVPVLACHQRALRGRGGLRVPERDDAP